MIEKKLNLFLTLPLLLLSVIFIFNLRPADSYTIRPISKKGVIDLRSWDFQKNGNFELEGEWEFYWNTFLDDEKKQKEYFNQLKPPEIHYINVPSEWQNYELEGKKLPAEGYAMYRLKVLLKPSTVPFGFSMTDICTAYNLYINGRLIYSRGKVGKTEEGTTPLLQYSTFPMKGEISEEMEIIFLVSNFHHSRGGFWNKLTIGNLTQIEKTYTKTIVIKSITFGSLMIMGFYHIFLYIMRPKDRTPFLFGVYCLVIMSRFLLMEERYILDIFPNLSFLVISKIEYLTFYIGVPLFLYYVYKLFPKEVSRYYLYSSLFLCFTAIFITIFFPLKYYSSHIFIVMELFLLISILYTIFVYILAIKRKRTGAILMFTGTIMFYLMLINDLMYGIGFIRTIHLAPYGLLVFVFFQSVMLSMKFSNAFFVSEKLALELIDKSDSLATSNKQLTELKDNLKQKVEERTLELEESYKKNYESIQKVYTLEKELAIKTERESVFRDIHDHIGGGLSDLFLLNQKLKLFQIPSEIISESEQLIRRITESVRSKMHYMEDMELIKKDFALGLQSYLLRRYTAIGRKLHFSIVGEDTEQLFSTIEKIGENLFFIIIEITNNDLKYGKETANWQLSFSKKEVSILLESETSFLYSEGFGTNNLQKRVDMLSGSMTQEQVESKFKILVKIPFFERGTSPF